MGPVCYVVVMVMLMFVRLVAEREVVVFCDLHGHSRKLNVFIYGCENK